jgi:5-methylcytosine-specific restriction enzyme B
VDPFTVGTTMPITITACLGGDLSRLDLTSAERIRQLAHEYEAMVRAPGDKYAARCEALAVHLERVARASVDERASIEFQRQLWDDEVVNATGQGNVPVDALLEDESLRRWLASESARPLPEGGAARRAAIRPIYDELLRRARERLERTPWLKIFRVLASFFPHDFTTVADRGTLQALHRALLGKASGDYFDRHSAVLARLDEVLGPCPRAFDKWVVRMTLPWRLCELLADAQEDTAAAPQPIAPAVAPTPLPAARRRRGMTATKGSYNTVLRVLDFVGDGVSRDDLYEFIRVENPALQLSSIRVNVNVLRSELGVLERRGDDIVPTQRGRDLLAEDDPFVLAPWLVTRILGLDHALVHLRDRGPTSTGELVRLVQRVNPNWTTGYAPGAIVSWLRSFGVVTTDQQQRLTLSEDGRKWAALVQWTPEALSPEEAIAESDEDPAADAIVDGSASTGPAIPSLKQILERFPPELRYDRAQLAALHAGLWSHPRRHFAILTGLSGSGKTSLAHAYAKALTAITSDPNAASVEPLVVAVSPGWNDPSALLGYANPLRPGQYVATEFLRYLLSCEANPSTVHVAVLDEMNLSHPEQYLAPLLSGMEVEKPIVLHDEDASLDGIPRRLKRYPANLVLIGTVNMDETTHGLSDKILDRAVTLEFWDIDLDKYPRWGTRGIAAADEQRARSVLGDLMTALAPLRLHFGWRVVDDILQFLKRAGEDDALEAHEALDWIVYSKIVPKLRGHDSPQFRATFARCGEVLATHALERSRVKVSELLRDLQETGTARFWR